MVHHCIVASVVSSLVFQHKNTLWVVVGFEFIRLALVWVARVPVSRPRDEVSRVSP